VIASPSVSDDWVAACGGTETPFRTRTGRMLFYMWNRTTGEHAYYDVEGDVFLTYEEASLALCMQ
jgi:hypothetical protein